MGWAWLAIGIGVLIIATRAPLILRPAETLELYRAAWATNTRARALGVVYLAAAVPCFVAALELRGPPRQIFTALGVGLVGVTAWTLAAPDHFRGVVDRVVLFVEVSVDGAAIRALAIIAVCVGGLLVWWGVRAL
jgi:hypothetical protein